MESFLSVAQALLEGWRDSAMSGIVNVLISTYNGEKYIRQQKELYWDCKL